MNFLIFSRYVFILRTCNPVYNFYFVTSRFRAFYRQPSSTFGKKRIEFGLRGTKTGLSELGRAEGERSRDGPGANVYRAKPRMYERVNHPVRGREGEENFGSACVAGGRRSRRP